VQNGQLIHRGKSWLFRYWKSEVVQGQKIRRRVCEKIADFDDAHRTEKSVRGIADKILLQQDAGKLTEGMTLQTFFDARYLPHIEAKRRPSTANGYRNLYRLHIQPRVRGVKLALFEASNGQRLLDEIAKDNPKIAKNTLIHVKSLLSGIFSYARRMGDYHQGNPMQGRFDLEGKKGKPTRAYTPAEVEIMLTVLRQDWMEFTAVIVAAYQGLSLSELRGLRFEDVGDSVLNVRNSYWRKFEGPTKTAARTAEVPLLGVVRDAIRVQQERNPGTKFVFEGPHGNPLDLATIGSKRISRALSGKVVWGGWHPFRRGLATNLHMLGVQDVTIQAILRHANVAITQASYIKAMPEMSIQAMKKLEKLVAAQNQE